MKRGFTLIELLVVIAIIGLLSSVIIASLNSSRTKAKYAAAKQLDANFSHNLGDSLVGQWLFDECSGTTATDSSGFGNNGSFVGAPLWSSDTPFGTGCSLSFSSSAVNLGNSATLNPLFMSAFLWIEPSATINPAWGVFFARWTGAQSYHFSVSDGTSANKLTIFINTSAGNKSVSAPIGALQKGQWSMVGFTYEGTSLRLYINGAPVASVNQTGPIAQGAIATYVGDKDGTFGFYFPGLIDNVRIYDRALDTAEVQKLYAEGAAAHGIALQ